MTARIIDGKHIASTIKSKLKHSISELTEKGLRPPKLVVVLVGDDPASHVYVSHKEKACREIGVESLTNKVPSTISQNDLESILSSYSKDESIDGILLQLPLPKHLNADSALDNIAADKDVDGLLPVNQGRLLVKKQGLYSCTPLGCMELIKSTGIDISGKHAVVIGRSRLVGLPISLMLNHANATVTMIHSKTVNPELLAQQADILVVAAGQHQLVKEHWIKPGAIIIDVGTNRVDGKLRGDVDFEKAKDIAGFITPVPGGVGPMTIAMLLHNCVTSYCTRLRIPL